MLPKGGSKFWGTLIDIKDKDPVTGDNMKAFLMKNCDTRVRKHLSKLSVGSSLNATHINSQDPRYWTNPMASKLPNAPNMKIHCFYGTTVPTEVGYHYKQDEKLHLNFEVNNPEKNTKFGIVESLEGDGTVTLDSLGWHCNEGWKTKLLNPHDVPVFAKEYEHSPGGVFEDGGISLRGGGKSADHVDIMGNVHMIRDLLKIVSGSYTKVVPKMYSKYKK
jgi:hypothetical protein